MKTITIKGNVRENVGKINTKMLRKNNNIPCVLYGGGETVHFSAHENEMRNLVYTNHVYLINLEIDGKSYLATQKDIQFHPVSDKILHMDFYQITEGKPIVIKVPVVLHGLAKGVQEGGKLALEHRRLSVKALSKDLPDQLDIDISELTLGKTIKVGELSFENLQLIDPKNWVVASVRLTRISRGMAAGEDELEAEEGAEGAEGAAEGEDKSEAAE